jgi:5-formyltetrahydrofolate cyclo-ligase
MDPTIKLWRRQQRASLLAQRQTIDNEARQHAAQMVARELDALVDAKGYSTIGLYWPIKHEINLLPWADALARRSNVVLCLPVVVTRNEPLEYWRWSQGEALSRGLWDIPIPARRDVVIPDLMLAPLVGFDQANYRLGYGGGYFDRTLASLGAAFTRRPMVAGVGYDFSLIETVFPQSHDIPMDAVITESRYVPEPDWRTHAA